MGQTFREIAQSRSIGLATVLFLSVSWVRPVSAQLRPVAPVNWHLVGGDDSFSGGIGVGLLTDQPASLAGTRGSLGEYGNFQIGLRSGQITLEVEGTLLRRFQDREVVQPPVAGSDPPTRLTRRDAGDVVASTAIRINGTGRGQLALRFGTRLPTPSNEVGLDRDRTDFFSTLAGRFRAGPLALSAEGGLAILGTRVDGLDQLDVLVYATGLELVTGSLSTSGQVVGQNDMHRGAVRGNEDLSELRLGLTVGDRTWVSATGVVGLADFSPHRGLLLMVGLRR